MAGLYMGPSSAFGGAFGAMPGPAQNGTPPNGGMRGMVPGSPPTQGSTSTPAGKGLWGSQPITTPQQTTPIQPWGANSIGPQAVRATGPSQGYDASYLQNLATAIGGLFSNPQGGNVMNVNPLGNLAEISPTSGQLGNAPQPGLPQTWLQQALAGLGFGYTPSTPPNQSIVNNPPRVGSIGGNGGGNGPRVYQ
jgi:hypothetical protein